MTAVCVFAMSRSRTRERPGRWFSYLPRVSASLFTSVLSHPHTHAPLLSLHVCCCFPARIVIRGTSLSNVQRFLLPQGYIFFSLVCLFSMVCDSCFFFISCIYEFNFLMSSVDAVRTLSLKTSGGSKEKRINSYFPSSVSLYVSWSDHKANYLNGRDEIYLSEGYTVPRRPKGRLRKVLFGIQLEVGEWAREGHKPMKGFAWQVTLLAREVDTVRGY